MLNCLNASIHDSLILSYFEAFIPKLDIDFKSQPLISEHIKKINKLLNNNKKTLNCNNKLSFYINNT